MDVSSPSRNGLYPEFKYCGPHAEVVYDICTRSCHPEGDYGPHPPPAPRTCEGASMCSRIQIIFSVRDKPSRAQVRAEDS